LTTSCTIAAGKIIYVDDDAPLTGEGTSWDNAYCCLQVALAEAAVGDEIHVADGIYKPDRRLEKAGRLGFRITESSSRLETFQLLSGVTIKGGYAGVGAADPDARDINLYETILSGDLAVNDVDNNNGLASEESRAENSYHVVTANGVDETAVLDGFTITGGNANVFTNRNGAGLLNEYGSPQVVNCMFTQNSAQYYGGGIYNYYGSSGIVNCTFTRNYSGTEGGGIYNYQGSLNLNDCTFEENSSHRGGGIHSGHGSLNLTDCAFVGNLAHTGAGINNYAAMEASTIEIDEDYQSTPVLVNCTFITNSAEDKGGGLYSSDSKPSLKNCTFSNNSAGYGGGGICFNNSDPNLTDCLINENSTFYGGGIYNDSSSLTLICCKLVANEGYDYGGGMYNLGNSNLSLNNCIVVANRTNSYGGGIYNNHSSLDLTNCTFTGNSARNGSTIAFNSQWGQSTAGIIDCILWDDGEVIWINDQSNIVISYSNIRGGWSGTGNIDADPLFTDPNGSDDIPGTEDDNLRLAPSSPCADTGDPNYAQGLNKKDIAGNPRVVSGRVDMGAYESYGIIYVDNHASDDSGQDSLREDGSASYPFDTIQEAIDVAKDGHTVLVRPGVYSAIDFMGKAITVAGTEGAAMIGAMGNGRTGSIVRQDAVTFHTGEGPDSVLRNFIIKNSSTAISLNYGTSPTLRNLTIVDNDFGISAYENSNPDISNCIFFNNRDGDLFQCEARYSCFESEVPGTGNIIGNPLFVDPTDDYSQWGDNYSGDYHLMSEGWRWSTYEESWTWDEVTSSCIDAGDPNMPLGEEPLSTTRDTDNEYGLNLYINMGAYGGTCQASMAPPYWFPEYETDPPEPNPAQWTRDGKPREDSTMGRDRVVDYWLEMIAVEATDASGPIEYFFECTTDASLNSGWQIARNYEVLVDSAGQGHRFRVKARDRFGNETDWSEELLAD
jgi:parallel beta-helix repeat protein/predicted outer membrane repeat protein